MGGIVQAFDLGLQVIREDRVTIAELLTQKMDGVDGGGRRKTLTERLGLNGISCCGATWGLIPSTISVRDDDDDDEGPLPENNISDVGRRLPECEGHTPSASGMNLATALAAERQFRAGLDADGAPEGLSPSPVIRTNNNNNSGAGTPLRVSLLRLLEETDGVEEKGEGGGTVCCVCMGRKKGAAFIPCGHTFCRVCSRELWLNRGCCPLCNRPILQILDIF